MVGFTYPVGQTASAVRTHSRSSASAPSSTLHVVEESSGSGSTVEQSSGVPATTVPAAARTGAAGAKPSSGPNQSRDSTGATTPAASSPAATAHRPTRRDGLPALALQATPK